MMNLTARKTYRSEEGSIALLVAFAIVAMVGLGAMAMDTSFLSMGKGQLDTAVDSSSLSAVRQLDGTQTGVQGSASTALDYASRAVVAGRGLQLNAASDLAYGVWDERRQSFAVPTDLVGSRGSLNALEVTGRRTASRGSEFKTILGGIFGKTSMNSERKALAVGGGPSRTRVAPIALARDAVLAGGAPAIGTIFNVRTQLGAGGSAMFATLNGSFSGVGGQVDAYFAGNPIELNVVTSRVTAFSGPWINDVWQSLASRCPIGQEFRVPVVEAGALARCTSYQVAGFATVRVENFNFSDQSINVRLVSTRDQDARAGGPNYGTRAAKVFLASRTAAARPAPSIPAPFPVCGCPQPAPPPRRAD